MACRMLSPLELGLDTHGRLVVASHVPAGQAFLPWEGVVKSSARLPLPLGDIRLQYGGVDCLQGKERVCSWVLYIQEAVEEDTALLLGTFGLTGEPILTAARDLLPGEVVTARLEAPSAALAFPAVRLLRLALFTRYLENAVDESPLDLTKPTTELINTDLGSDGESSSSLCSPSSPESARSSPPPLSSPDTPLPSFPFSLPPPASALTGAGPSTLTALRAPRSKGRRLLPCETCGKEFDRPSLLKRHIRVHTGERPHVCDICTKGFSTSSSLNTHRRIHTGEKPHRCGVCGKRFTASSNLYYHRMTHVKDKPHPCSYCPKSFPTPGDLRSHMSVHQRQQISQLV